MLEIRSDWNRKDSEGRPIFTIFLTKHNMESFYYSCTEECLSDEYNAYKTLQAGLMELLHLAYPDAVKREFNEMKSIMEDLRE